LLTAGHFALDPEGAKALWAKSEEMAGERFDVPADQVADVIAL
jgi:hypothetical protein